MPRRFIIFLLGGAILILIIVVIVSARARRREVTPIVPAPTPVERPVEREGLVPAEEKEEIPAKPRLKIETTELTASVPIPSTEEGKVVFFDQKAGEFYTATEKGENIEPLTQLGLKGVEKVIWSPKKDKAILYFPEEKRILNLEDKSQITLDKRITSATFSPDGTKILYKFDSDDIHNLFQASIDDLAKGRKIWKKIKDTGPGDLVLHWYQKDRIAYHSPASGYSRSTIYTCNLEGKDLKILASDNYGSAAKWSPDGSKMIFTTSLRKSPSLKLHLASGEGKDIKDLGMDTLVEKCTFTSDSKYLICALPSPISSQYVMPNDWYDKKLFTIDSFWKIDTLSLERTKIATSDEVKEALDQNVDASDLFISADGTKLFFINRRDQRLYYLTLP